MYNTLYHLMKKPALYERTEVAFWNDPHISKGMLEAHLDPETDAASRKPEFIQRSVGWISSLLPAGASLLDIGCGPGLYTIRLAQRGFSTTGLDLSERSIAYARQHDPLSDYVLMNYLKMDYDNRFDAITLIWCDFGALLPPERSELLRRVYRALKPGGFFLFDVFTPLWNLGRKDHASWQIWENGGFFSPNSHLRLDAEYHYDECTSLRRHVIIEEDRVHAQNIWNICFSRQGLIEEASPWGFVDFSFFSDVTGTPYSDNSTTLCAVMRKA